MREFFLPVVVAGMIAASPLAAQDISVVYLRQDVPPPPTLSNLDPIPGDLGQRGAELALQDNATTGKFMGQNWALEIVTVPEGGDYLAAMQDALAKTDLMLLDAPAEQLTAAADLAPNALLFNVANADNALRDDACRANLLHTLPSRAMKADALMQFFVKRRWTDIAMITGEAPGDVAFADALDRSATKFGLKIGKRKTWAFDADMRRNAAQEVPLFTQDLGDYDVLLVADEANDFARYIPYNTWHPRPVAGAEGLTAHAWDRVVEQWGAAQLQSRFHDLTGRDMQDVDYAAWAAIRTLGEAVTRTKSADTATLRSYILGPDFELAGFKGRPQTFRTWNGQLRQPMPLTSRAALVAQAPLDGFLHQRSELDTLGLDKPESACSAFD
ncbi:ABC transporter substrate-binding protein [Tropicibacter naphthalenivorans]|uniref:ABC transporter, substrate binding protein, PQQ-dependent alcohol dehydrogenase system n=1 Tax=Tropicibacter naphthalenivorans TaxID=441103 RepID=A0A0P1G6J1_9RHOB|nr:ABC transporter substrate-binding protein [Tropicibacter naphthalenivorans]CUH77338.1 ABC transporter, substrate binding protein, PQQ-dependent alcohol dehydrogenase system [Tropicibacter naphthalenivorans]SMC58858.1 ABC transporter, substrate binding protein, PQQ-dependent alcohol dehydrogenase system [Tropicibacter naphthalenivorans]